MKTFFGLVALALVMAGVVIYVDGARLPYYHTVSVSGVVAGTPDKVFARIVNVKDGADWRPAVKSVTVLVPDKGRDHWVELMAHNQYMTYLAVRTEAPFRRDVQLDDPKASYGGTWTYELEPGPEPDTTTLHITETGFIKPPIYRFAMAHVFGPTRNLDQYMKDIQLSAKP